MWEALRLCRGLEFLDFVVSTTPALTRRPSSCEAVSKLREWQGEC